MGPPQANGVDPAVAPSEQLVSVLIVSFNTKGLLADCLASLREVAYRPLEVIVADNGSSDGSPEMVRREFPEILLLEADENEGFVGGSLRAYAQARGDFVCFLNSDTRVEPAFLDELVAFMHAHPDAGGCEPKILWMRDPTRLDSVGDWLTWSGMLYHQGYLQPDEGLDSPFPIFSAKGACMLFRASLLRQIGAFDEAYWAYFEETDLCWRVWLAGYRVYFVPSARVLHLLAGTSRQVDTYAITFHSFKNRIHSMLKNFGAVYLWRVLPVHLAICVGLVGGYALRGHWRKARAIWSALWWNLRHARHTWRQRHRVQREIRTVTDRELMRFAMAPVSLRYLWDLYREYERV